MAVCFTAYAKFGACNRPTWRKIYSTKHSSTAQTQ
jgi:hypothetical protein